MNIETFFKLSYGLYIVSSQFEGKLNGHINNTVFQVTAEPPKLAVCSHKNNLTTDFILKSKKLSISVIQEQVDLEYIGHFGFKSGREFNKFQNIDYKLSESGCPFVLDRTIGAFDCEVENSLDLGTHILFIVNVKDAELFDKDKNPLTYSYYRNVIKGLSPKNAPTYIDKDKLTKLAEKPKSKSPEYICNVCGYIYNPEEGDPTCGISPGTPFEDLPDDWECPICAAGKEVFNIL